MIRENPRNAEAKPGHRNIGRGSCRSAWADGVGTPVHSSGTEGIRSTLDGGPRDPSARSIGYPPHPPPLSSLGIGGARGLGNSVRPESHPEPRGFPVQWADPEVSVGEAIAFRSAPPSYPCCHGPIGLFAPFHRPSVPM